MRAFIAFSFFTAVLALLTGCATGDLAAAWQAGNGPPLSRTAHLKGRAFELGKVSTLQSVTASGGINTHCLPDWMYAAMLRQDLSKAFSVSGLTRGRLPSVPVNVAIQERSFKTNLAQGLTASNFVVKLEFDKINIPVGLSGAGMAGMLNRLPEWRRQQRLIPAMTVAIVRDLRSVQKGLVFRSRDSFDGGRGTIDYFSGGSLWNLYTPGTLSGVNSYHLVFPMSVAEFEQATGKTAKELAAICKARIAGN